MNVRAHVQRQTELRKREKEEMREKREMEGRSKHEYSTTEFIRHFMHSRRALLCIHFYGLESDFLLPKVWERRGAEATGLGRKMVKDGSVANLFQSFVSYSFSRLCHRIVTYRIVKGQAPMNEHSIKCLLLCCIRNTLCIF